MSVLRYYFNEDKIEKFQEKYKRTVVRIDPRIKTEAQEFSDAGIDLFAPYDFVVDPFGIQVVDTFIVFDIPGSTVGLIRPRGGDDFLVGSGVVDAGYRGTVKVKIFNHSSLSMYFNAGDSIGQIIFVPLYFQKGVHLVESDNQGFEVGSTARQDAGRINQA